MTNDNKLTLTQRLLPDPHAVVSFTLALTAQERTRSRYRFETNEGQVVLLRLPRGTVLRDGDILQAEANSSLVRIVAKSEPVFTVTAQTELDLLRAAYHLGNRHVPVEITTTYLKLSPDRVLQTMLEHLGMNVQEAILPFHPEIGAYADSHTHG